MGYICQIDQFLVKQRKKKEEIWFNKENCFFFLKETKNWFNKQKKNFFEKKQEELVQEGKLVLFFF